MYSDRKILPSGKTTVAPDRRGRLVFLSLIVAFALGVAAWLTQGAWSRALFVMALTLGMVVIAIYLLPLRNGMFGRGLRSFHALLGNDPVACIATDRDGRVLGCNAAAKARFVGSQGQSLADTLKALLPNPASVMLRLYGRAQKGDVANETVTLGDRTLRMSVYMSGNDMFIWRFEDMPEQAVSWRDGLDDLPVPMLTIGPSDTILQMNTAARTLIGQDAETLAAVFDQTPVNEAAIKRIHTGSGLTEVAVLEHRLGNGRREIFLFPMKSMAVINPDIIFETVPVPMIKISPAGKITMANRPARALLKMEIGRDTMLEEIVQGLGRPVSTWIADALGERSHSSSEFVRLSGRDEEVFLQVTLNRVTEENSAMLIAVLNDATELKTLEAQFVQSQKMQAIGQLAGGVAHDFNNLLTAISGHCDLLLLRHDQGDQDYGDLVQIHQNANRAAALVGQLLAFSRKQTLRPETLDLRDTLSDLTHLLNRLVGEKVTLSLKHEPVLRPVRTDKRQLEQVMMNLVVNARDAMPNGGEVQIETEVTVLTAPLKRDRATVPAGEYVTVKISDEGIGIPVDKLPKVFEPFYTTKRAGEGTGLGLSTAYGIVKQTGGFIFVDSVPGAGTTFTLYFPVHIEDEVRTDAVLPKASNLPEVQRQGVILLVEDEAPVRAFASRALRLRGFTVVEADSAEAALDVLDDESLSVDVFVTDVIMPGMDGPSWVRQAMKTRPDVRVVFVSGYAEGAFGDTMPDVPNSVFLPKPFSLNQLTDTVNRQLH